MFPCGCVYWLRCFFLKNTMDVCLSLRVCLLFEVLLDHNGCLHKGLICA